MPSEDRGLERLAALLVAGSGLHFRAAAAGEEREAALALRRAAVEEKGWRPDEGPGAPADRDEFDQRCLHLVGWAGETAMCCGRIVPPPRPLPTELACGIIVEPVGAVVEVGRMVVAPEARDPGGRTFLALLAALYLEVHGLGFPAGCGMMAPNVRELMTRLGVPHDVLGPDRLHRGDLRAPVRFAVATHGPDVVQAWS